MLPYRFRRLHHAWAYVAGYFWTPCPVCGEDFGGHEWRDRRHTIWKGSRGVATCPKCPVDSPRIFTGAELAVFTRSREHA